MIGDSLTFFLRSKYFKEIFFLIGKDIKKIPFIIVFFLLVGVLDLLSIGVIVPFVGFILNPETIYQMKYINFFYDFISNYSEYEIFIIFSISLVLIFVLKVSGIIILQFIIIKFGNNKLTKLRSILLRNYQLMPYNNFIERNSSKYIYAMNSLCPTFTSRVLVPILKMISDIITCSLILFFLIWFSGLVLIYFFLFVFALVMLYYLVFRSKLNFFGKLKNISNTNIIKILTESIYGFKEIRIINAEKYFYKDLLKNARNYSNIDSFIQTVSLAPRYLLELLIILSLVGMLVFSHTTDNSYVEAIPLMTMFSFAAIRLLPLINSIFVNIINLRANRNSVNLLYKDFKALGLQKPLNLDLFDNKSLNKFKEMEFKNITYRYPGSKKTTINNLTFSIKSGQFLGIVGSSGSGKTTVLNLLLGFLTPSSGQIFFNGKNIEDANNTWIQNFAYIPQEIFLIDDSLKKNIALGVPNNEINKKRLSLALKKTKLSSLISNLPMGEDTIIGDRGIKLSGGQRQRIAIARALYFNRNVLILDEATSELDEISEKEIVNQITQLGTNVTIIMIAHRLNSLIRCDEILKIENGQIVDKGSFTKVIGNI